MIKQCDYCTVDTAGNHELYCPVGGFMTRQDSNGIVHYTPYPFSQGWQCPVCRKVYAPSVTMCKNCSPLTEFKRIMNNNHTHHFCLDTAVVPHDNPELEAREIFAYCECGLTLKDKDIVKALDAYINAVNIVWHDWTRQLADEYDRTSRDMMQQEWEMMTLGAWEE